MFTELTTIKCYIESTYDDYNQLGIQVRQEETKK